MNTVIKYLPNIIVINCGYAYRIHEGGNFYDEMREHLLECYEDRIEFLTSYKDFDMQSCFVVKFNDVYNGKIGLDYALTLIYDMSYIKFCGFFDVSNIVKIEITDEYCYFRINTESG